MLIDPFSPKAVSDEWTSSNLIGTAPSLQPCRYSPWFCLGDCLTMTKKLNLFRYHFPHLLMGITASQLWVLPWKAVQGQNAIVLYCIINIFLARFCQLIFSSIGSCPSVLISFHPRVESNEGRVAGLQHSHVVDWDSHKKFWHPGHIRLSCKLHFFSSEKMGQRAMGRDITWSDMMFSLSVFRLNPSINTSEAILLYMRLNSTNLGRIPVRCRMSA